MTTEDLFDFELVAEAVDSIIIELLHHVLRQKTTFSLHLHFANLSMLILHFKSALCLPEIVIELNVAHLSTLRALDTTHFLALLQTRLINDILKCVPVTIGPLSIIRV